MAIVKSIENAIIPLDLDWQGEFISLTNALDVQLESGAPVPDVVRFLGDAIIALARERGLPQRTQTHLSTHLSTLNDRVRGSATRHSGR